MAQRAAPAVKRVSQELGDKSANIILTDADFQKTVKAHSAPKVLPTMVMAARPGSRVRPSGIAKKMIGGSMRYDPGNGPRRVSANSIVMATLRGGHPERTSYFRG